MPSPAIGASERLSAFLAHLCINHPQEFRQDATKSVPFPFPPNLYQIVPTRFGGLCRGIGKPIDIELIGKRSVLSESRHPITSMSLISRITRAF